MRKSMQFLRKLMIQILWFFVISCLHQMLSRRSPLPSSLVILIYSLQILSSIGKKQPGFRSWDEASVCLYLKSEKSILRCFVLVLTEKNCVLGRLRSDAARWRRIGWGGCSETTRIDSLGVPAAGWRRCSIGECDENVMVLIMLPRTMQMSQNAVTNLSKDP